MEAVSTDQKEKIWQMLEKEPHRVFEAQGIATILKPAAARKPEELQQLVNEITPDLKKLVEEGKAREVLDGGFKARLFTNETKHIEHAFIGGMGNTSFRFKSPIFRLNIGVIALFFIRSQKEQNWMILVRDSTAGTTFCLRTRLKDGNYRFGSEVHDTEPKDYIPIVGRYIEQEHVAVTLRGDDVMAEDNKTITGSRIDLLTTEGFSRYQEVAQEFLKTADSSNRWDPVRRGRFVMDQVLQHKKNFEITFFGASVDSVLLQEMAGQ